MPAPINRVSVSTSPIDLLLIKESADPNRPIHLCSGL